MQVMGGVPQGLTLRRLEREAFPELCLSAQAHDEAHARLIEDFHAWQAAWLLVLPDLEPEVRGRLERCARQQALVVQSQHRLYPQTVDRPTIRAALVEAVLRRAESAASGREAGTSPFYIELDPGPPA
jgi:hypothetical protein